MLIFSVISQILLILLIGFRVTMNTIDSDISDRAGSFSEKIRENLFLVNNVSVIHENVKLIFSTLWTNISPGKSI